MPDTLSRDELAAIRADFHRDLSCQTWKETSSALLAHIDALTAAVRKMLLTSAEYDHQQAEGDLAEMLGLTWNETEDRFEEPHDA